MSVLIFEYTSPDAASLYDDKPPGYASQGAAAVDLRVAETVSFPLAEGGYKVVGTGLRLSIPKGMGGLLMPRSSLYQKTGCLIPNSPGLIDSDYRGEIKIPLLCNIVDSVTIPAGTRVAQLAITYMGQHQFKEADLDETERGHGGFGSTGV